LPENRAKVESARFLRREMQNERQEAVNVTAAETSAEKPAGFWQSIQNFFTLNALVPAAGFAVLLFIVGGLWVAFRTQPNNEIVYSPPPAPTAVPVQSTSPIAPEANYNAPANTNQTTLVASPTVQRNVNAPTKETPRADEPKGNVKPTPRQTPPPAQSSVTLALVMGLVRGGSEANKLVLPKNANQVRLTFDLPAREIQRNRGEN
jgi:hypothetical protein